MQYCPIHPGTALVNKVCSECAMEKKLARSDPGVGSVKVKNEQTVQLCSHGFLLTEECHECFQQGEKWTKKGSER